MNFFFKCMVIDIKETFTRYKQIDRKKFVT